MREKLVDLLRCPQCRRDEARLHLRVDQADAGEVQRGFLTCGHCGTEYQVRDGVAHLLAGGERTVVGESRAYRSSRPKLLDAWGEDPEAQLAIARMEHTSEQFRRSSAMNLAALWEGINPQPNEWVLELGAGSCLHTVEMAKRGCTCIALDISTDLKLELGHLLAAKENVVVDRVVGDMGNLPFRSEVIGVVYSTASLHHSSDLRTSLAEAARVLGRGGRFGAANEPMHGPLSWSSLSTCARAMEELPGSHEASYTLQQWQSGLRAAGLDATFLWPPYYDYLLESGAVGTKFGCLGRVLASLWRLDPLRRAVKHSLFGWLQMAVGVNVLLAARKHGT